MSRKTNPKMKPKIRTVHQHFRTILLIAQCLGIMPVSGITKKNAWFIKFSWKSKRTLCSIGILLLTAFMTLMSAMFMIWTKPYLWKWTHFSFYACCLITGFLFLHLAPNWPKLMVSWNKVEYSTKFLYQNQTSRKFSIITWSVLGTAVVEHILSEINSYNKLKGNDDYLRGLTMNDNPGLAYFLPYSVFLGVFSKIMNLIGTFSWSFIDLFIMLVSVALADIFKQISVKISSTPHSRMTANFWKELRENYSQLCDLYEKTETAISFITLLSFTSNLYFILIQLYLSIRIRGAAFFFSFGLLLARTLSVCIFAAQVYDESKRPLDLLIFLPSHVYCDEVERLIDQINVRTIALTGYKLFNITRGLIFRIAATIVTYELFLFQFNVTSAFN